MESLQGENKWRNGALTTSSSVFWSLTYSLAPLPTRQQPFTYLLEWEGKRGGREEEREKEGKGGREEGRKVSDAHCYLQTKKWEAIRNLEVIPAPIIFVHL